MANNSAPSRPKVSGEENREQREIKYKEQVWGRDTTSARFLQEDQEKTGFVHTRDSRGERIQDSRCEPHVEQTRHRSVRHGNQTEQDSPRPTGLYTSSSATNQESRRNMKNYPVTGANAIQLPFLQTKRYTPARTLKQTNSILLQLAGYTRYEKN